MTLKDENFKAENKKFLSLKPGNGNYYNLLKTGNIKRIF